MKRVLISFLILGLLTGSVATAGAKKKTKPTRVERTVEGTYGALPSPVIGCNDPFGPWACLVVKTRGTERFVTAKVTDTHGQPVFVQVIANGGRELGVFCGETSKPIAFKPGSTLEFHLASTKWPGDNAYLDCPANRLKTTGMISATLSNLP